MLHEELSGRVLWCFYEVCRILGVGFFEKVYENALLIELRKQGLQAVQQHSINVLYNGQKVGEYIADIVVENTIILELKVAKQIGPEHEAQLLNYLRATTYELGFILNFGAPPTYIRRVYSNERKANAS